MAFAIMYIRTSFVDNMNKPLDECSMLSLSPGERAKIVRINSEEVELALLKVGIRVGASCKRAGRSPLNDPIAFTANQVKVFVRKKDAAQIWMNKLS